METVKQSKETAFDFVCGNCPHWSRRIDLTSQRNTDVGDAGDCRYAPPVLLLVPVTDQFRGQGLSIQPHFPITLNTSWCGNHPGRKALVAVSYMLDALDILREREPGIVHLFGIPSRAED